MKIYGVSENSGTLSLQSNEAKVTGKQIMLAEPKRAWHYRVRFNKLLPLNTTPYAAVRHYMDDLIRSNLILQARIRANQLMLEKARKLCDTLPQS